MSSVAAKAADETLSSNSEAYRRAIRSKFSSSFLICKLGLNKNSRFAPAKNYFKKWGICSVPKTTSDLTEQKTLIKANPTKSIRYA